MHISSSIGPQHEGLKAAGWHRLFEENTNDARPHRCELNRLTDIAGSYNASSATISRLRP